MMKRKRNDVDMKQVKVAVRQYSPEEFRQAIDDDNLSEVDKIIRSGFNLNFKYKELGCQEYRYDDEELYAFEQGGEYEYWGKYIPYDEDKYGEIIEWTPIMYAVGAGSKKSIVKLLDHHCDMSICDKTGRDVFAISRDAIDVRKGMFDGLLLKHQRLRESAMSLVKRNGVTNISPTFREKFFSDHQEVKHVESTPRQDVPKTIHIPKTSEVEEEQEPIHPEPIIENVVHVEEEAQPTPTIQNIQQVDPETPVDDSNEFHDTDDVSLLRKQLIKGNFQLTHPVKKDLELAQHQSEFFQQRVKDIVRDLEDSRVEVAERELERLSKHLPERKAIALYPCESQLKSLESCYSTSSAYQCNETFALFKKCSQNARRSFLKNEFL